ncbi:hypothetical protein ACHAW5_004239 [Stephanodiscus triporus]|uniref:Uncharacterized protein n=1 Tax=Stephanodiscus triporus TaxID=2934178 RepID=A0ABD3NZP1_9STRA
MQPSAPPTTTPSPLPPSPPPSAPPPPLSSSTFPLDATVPSVVEDLAWIISVGGCPECGSTTDCARVGERTGSSSRSRSPFLCSSCSTTFYAWDERLRVRRDVMRRRGGDCEDCDRDGRAYLGKRRLSSIARGAYREICRGEMVTDRDDFVREIRELRHKIRAERRKVFGLLELPLEEEAGGEEEEYDDKDDGSSRDGGTSVVVAGGARATTSPPPPPATTSTMTTTRDGEGSTMMGEGDPFGASILLIRRATLKLEMVVANLLLRCGDLSSSPSPSKSSSVADERGTGASSSGEDEDDPSSFVDVAYDRQSASVTPSSGGGGGEYRLASRIRQEGGEEIEIFEKCSTTGEG